MTHQTAIDTFLANYPEAVHTRVLQLREVLLEELPAITEQLDLPAKMIAYCYGQKYVEMICTVFPSQKGVKLGFYYKDMELPDPEGLLEGNGKISRYVVIRSEEMIHSEALKNLIRGSLAAFRQRMAKKK